MTKLTTLALMAATAAIMMAGNAVQAQTNVGVSIGIHQPGVYGRIDIGNYPQPAVVYPQPVVIAPPVHNHPVLVQPAVVVQRQPIYLYVPTVHQQNWGRYCNHYNACGQPVYFVQERWVHERYAHEHPGWHGERHARFERGEHRGEARHDGRDSHGAPGGQGDRR